MSLKVAVTLALAFSATSAFSAGSLKPKTEARPRAVPPAGMEQSPGVGFESDEAARMREQIEKAKKLKLEDFQIQDYKTRCAQPGATKYKACAK
ncbi:hypothetical protein [Rhizobium leguminosarum]|uniref:hypothetical protein n=1 Tax=Rhizobium leguminosarum TaxID=384 RepID=UPI00103F6DC9|nr:hypothetical protein [Rhizobium leguminosarum]TBZ70219.1 hypothetical protein E0H61_31370 [Rhizobium leguminosarum bv. viciae]TBZ89809.1 hypothetical protein E0H56_23135 [Rhizobium leguminosarum bv. viciae]